MAIYSNIIANTNEVEDFEMCCSSTFNACQCQIGDFFGRVVVVTTSVVDEAANIFMVAIRGLGYLFSKSLGTDNVVMLCHWIFQSLNVAKIGDAEVMSNVIDKTKITHKGIVLFDFTLQGQWLVAHDFDKAGIFKVVKKVALCAFNICLAASTLSDLDLPFFGAAAGLIGKACIFSGAATGLSSIALAFSGYISPRYAGKDSGLAGTLKISKDILDGAIFAAGVLVPPGPQFAVILALGFASSIVGIVMVLYKGRQEWLP